MSHAWPCSGWGLPSRPDRSGRWCALTAPFHPYLVRNRSPPSAVCSLWHFPAGRPDWPLTSTLPSGAPTFLEPVPCEHDPVRGHPADSPSLHCASAMGVVRPQAVPSREIRWVKGAGTAPR